MNEKIKEYLGKAKAALGKVSKKIWIIAAVVLVLLAAGITVFLNTRPYTVLITSSNSDEISTVLSWLDTQGVRNYRLEGSDTILVPSDQEVVLKARLMMEGYPKQGFSYSPYYDNVSALSTEAERNRAYLILIQERLSAIIECLDGVGQAIVQIDQSSGRNSVLSGGNMVQATASVTVITNNGERLSSQMAEGIRNLVSHSVQGLDVNSVTILDQWGNTYNKTGGSEAADADASTLKIQLEEEWSSIILTRIMQLVTPLYGEGNVRGAVSVVVELNNTTIDDHDVRLPDYAQDGSTGGRGIIGSLIYDHEYVPTPGTGAGGVVGTESNADWPQYVEDPEAPEDDQQLIGTSGQIDMNNSTTDTHTVRTAGYIADCTVALVINSTTAGAVDTERIQSLVAAAAGITAVETETLTAEEYLDSKVQVVTESFYDPNANQPGDGDGSGGLPVPMWVIIAAAIGLLVFVVILVVVLLLNKKRKKKQQALEEQQTASVEELLAAAGVAMEESESAGADVMDIQTERSMELRKDIRQFVDENPEIAAQMIKNWLKGDDDNG